MIEPILKWLEWLLRHAIVYPILRLLFHNPEHRATIDLNSVKRLLILRYDRIGDMIVTTPFFGALKRINPALEIGILASPANVEVIRFNEHLDYIHILHRNWFDMVRTLHTMRSLHYDVVINLIFNRTTTGGLLANFTAPHAVKVGQGAEKYRFYFNKLLSLPRANLHMVEILATYFEQTFGLSFDRMRLTYEIEVGPGVREQVAEFLARHGLHRRDENNDLPGFVVLNISAKEQQRQLSYSQSVEIVRVLAQELQYPVVVISSPEDSPTRDRIVMETDETGVHTFPERGTSTLLEIVELLRSAALVVTPETAIVHIASAAGTPVLGFYLQEHHDEWLPRGVPFRILRAEPGTPLDRIPVRKIQQFLREFHKELIVRATR